MASIGNQTHDMEILHILSLGQSEVYRVTRQNVCFLNLYNSDVISYSYNSFKARVLSNCCKNAKLTLMDVKLIPQMM